MALGVGRKELVMVGVLLTGTLLAVLNLTMLSPALPAIMGDLGVDAVVSGGQTMNPSTEDILAAIQSVPAKTCLLYTSPSPRDRG